MTETRERYRVVTPRRITFIVPGEPVGKARARIIPIPPRFNPKTGKTAYMRGKTPEKTKLAEAGIRYYWEQSGQQPFPADTALAIRVRAFFTRPKSAPKRRVYPTIKPDYDNVVKTVSDSLSGFAYDDDSRIVQATIEKLYAVYPDQPRLEVEIWEVL